MTPQKTPAIVENEIKRMIGTIERNMTGVRLFFLQEFTGTSVRGLLHLSVCVNISKNIKTRKGEDMDGVRKAGCV